MIVLFHHRDKVQRAKEKLMNKPCDAKPQYRQVTNWTDQNRKKIVDVEVQPRRMPSGWGVRLAVSLTPLIENPKQMHPPDLNLLTSSKPHCGWPMRLPSYY